MIEDLLKILSGFEIEEVYFLQDDAIPTYVIVSPESDKILGKIGELSEIEADVISLTPEEREELKESESEISTVVLNIMKKGKRLV
jgi:glucosamine 6-phosphate synthetase-like amidotransferase/phosphosugar isomerase protein